MHLRDFDFDLPPSAIAQYPAPRRDAARLLVLDRRHADLRHHTFSDLPDLLDPGDLVVVNRSAVLPARLLGRRQTGGRVEVLLLRDLGGHRWETLLRPGARIRAGAVLQVDEDLAVIAEGAGNSTDGIRTVRLDSSDPNAAIARAGHVPLPPYVRRPDEPADRVRYQTVYARETGSVAAPTAGLHFTTDLLSRLQSRGIRLADIVLHVGPGTFRPVLVEDVRRHRVAAEPFQLPIDTATAIREARARGRRVVAVGTTTVRTLESCARGDRTVDAGVGETDLVIVPGFAFQVTDALVTNFHLPRSSLLLLVAAFAGRARVLSAYAEALQAGYRFYSYGDAMLIL